MMPINRPVRAVTATARDSTRRLNEDTYTVQASRRSGAARFSDEGDLREYTILTTSPMPRKRI